MELVTNAIEEILCSLSPLSEEAKERIGEILIRRELEKGEVFLKEGQISRYIGFIEKGMIRQFYYKNGKDLTEHFACEGAFFMCIESFIRQRPTRLMVETLEPSVIWGLPHEGLEKLMEYSEEIKLLYRRILEHSLISSQQKADSWRFETAQERYKILMKNQPEVIRRAPMAYIASYLLMTPEMLSRVRAAL
ncbi:MAG: Crp/Fnr family transcriptional regulator [Bacteroides sp.]|nr:Crp/Fnr family transcriptional regulator [Bacteroides sp.]